MATPAQAAPRGLLGVSSSDSFGATDAERASSFGRLLRTGVDRIRVPFDWSTVETSPNYFDLAALDRFVALAAGYRLSIVPVLDNAPQFRERAPASGRHPPAFDGDMSVFAQLLTWRYGPDGTLWGEQPSVPYRPIRTWQVWNAPNLPSFWPPRPSTREYAGMLKLVGGSIKALDPSARILTGGLANSRRLGAIGVRRFIGGLYTYGAEPFFDGVALNAEVRDHRELTRLLRTARRSMNARGDRATPLWVSEFGWADRGPRSRVRVGRAGQAERIGNTLTALERGRRRLRLGGAFYHSWQDFRPAGRDFSGFHTGLLDRSGRAKPALRALARTLKRLGWRVSASSARSASRRPRLRSRRTLTLRMPGWKRPVTVRVAR